MHTRILIAGDDQMTLVADGTLLKDNGLYVYPVTSLDDLPELIAEVKPDVIFFDTVKMDDAVKAAYHTLVNDARYKDIPIIFTITEDEMYLVTPKRTKGIMKKIVKAESVIDAVKMALKPNAPDLSKYYVSRHEKSHLHSSQLQLSLDAA